MVGRRKTKAKKPVGLLTRGATVGAVLVQRRKARRLERRRARSSKKLDAAIARTERATHELERANAALKEASRQLRN